MINLSSRGRRKLSAASASASATPNSTVFAAQTCSIITPFLACFTLPLRRNSTIYHNSALSERVIEEDERQKQLMTSTIDDLPDYLLLEIFKRLPLNSIFRAKSVNKRWNFLITDPLFPHCYASASRKRSCSPPFALFYTGFIPGSNHPCQIGPYFPPFPHHQTHTHTFPLNFFTAQLQKMQNEIQSLQLIGRSSDLLLFSSDVFHVCNPLTFTWITLHPPPRHGPRHPVVGFMVEDDGTFWIVQILASDFLPSRLLVFQVYCSSTAQWSSNGVICPGQFDSFTTKTKTTQVYQGSLVWMVEDGLLWYDPRARLIRVVDLPHDRRRRGSLGVSCGRLHYYELSRYDPALRVWMMSDSGAGDWVVNYVIRHDHFWSSDESLEQFLALPDTQRYLRWVSFNPTDCDVVFLKCDRQLVTCKLSSACLEVVPCRFDAKEGIFYRLEWDVIPLVFKAWPTAVFIASKPKEMMDREYREASHSL